MSDARIPYRCARGYRCANRTRVDHDPACECRCHGQSAMDAQCDVEGGCGSLENPEGPPRFEGGAILAPAGLCEACYHRVDRALEELPLDYVELHFLLASGESGITSDVVMGSRELQIPMRVSIEALQASMVHEVSVWSIPLARKLGIDWAADQGLRCRPSWLLGRGLKLLRGGLETFLALPERTYRYALDTPSVTRDGIGAALELMRMHEMVRFAAGKTKLIHELPSPCPRCERMTLVRHNGTEHVTCESCGVRWPEKDYTRLTLILAEDYRDVEIERKRVALTSGTQGTVGSAAGGYQVPWPSLPMVEFPESAEQESASA